MDKTCELCGFMDNSYNIEDDGQIHKVCKFCHDGFLERMGLTPEDNSNMSDYDKTLKTIDGLMAEELAAVPNTKKPRGKKASAVSSSNRGQAKVATTKIPTPKAKTDTKATVVAVDKALEKKIAKEEKFITRQQDMVNMLSPRIDDERIKITSPEVELREDNRPKTNFDVAAKEYNTAIRFKDKIKIAYNKFLFLTIVLMAVTTVSIVQAVTYRQMLEPVVTAVGGILATVLGFLILWIVSLRQQAVRRAFLMRIKQQRILFESHSSDCYRELKTKYTVIKGISTALFYLAYIVPAIVMVGTLIAGVILTFLFHYAAFAAAIGASVIAATILYFGIMLVSELIQLSLDKEKNQQLQQQTLLDILHNIKKG